MKSIIKSLKTFNQKYFTFFLSAYLAAGLSFIISLLRDYLLIFHTNYSIEFFEIFYVVSLISTFTINSIMISFPPTKRFLFWSLLLTMCILFISVKFFFLFPLNILLLSIFILVAWITGAVLSRSLIVKNKIFLGRSREIVSSFFFIILILLNFDLTLTIIIGLFLSLMWVGIVSWPYRSKYFSTSKIQIKFTSYLGIILISNLTGSIMLIWAILINRSNELIYGYDPTLIVRFSLYIYQGISIGSVILITFTHFFKKNRDIVNLLFFLIILLCIFIIFANFNLSIIILPILLGIGHYLAMIILNLNFGEKIKRSFL
jgi:hypothetical protein